MYLFIYHIERLAGVVDDDAKKTTGGLLGDEGLVAVTVRVMLTGGVCFLELRLVRWRKTGRGKCAEVYFVVLLGIILASGRDVEKQEMG